jgi:hypothetical protein
MMKKLLAALGMGHAANSTAGAAEFYKPYAEPHINFLYNLLFCDDIALFKNESTAESHGLWPTLLADEPDFQALMAIAENEHEESRIRILAYHRLRAEGQPVPPKILLGVVVEVPLPQGLDVLAAFADGRVRYLNQSGRAAIFEEGGAPQVEALAKELIGVSQPVVNQIGPWDQQRLPPPRQGNVRMTFLVSDGLYFGEGPFETLQKDALGGPVLAKASQLLQLVVEMGLK